MSIIADTHVYLQSEMSILKNQMAVIFPKVLVSLAILLLFLVLAWFCRWIVQRILGRLAKNQVIVASLAKSAQVVVLLIGIVTALGTVGVNVGALVASLGLLGFACGFAFKDFLSNAIAGVMLLIYQPFKIHDHIMLDAVKGQVVEINLRYTVLHEDQGLILVPNQVLLSRTVRVVNDRVG